MMDALVGEFEGYTAGNTWNGWACPYFERQVAEAFLKPAIMNGYKMGLNIIRRDVFPVWHRGRSRRTGI